MPVETNYTMRDVCEERDENLRDALLTFYKLAKDAKEQKQTGQIVMYAKDGILDTWSAPRTGRIRRTVERN